METLSRSVATYLNSLGTHIRAVDACVVTIGGEERPAARYTQRSTPPAGARNPTPYESLRFYVLGELPAVVRSTPARRHGSGICFPYAGEEWYVGGGYTNHLLKPFGKATGGTEFAKQNPLGEWFSLDRWIVPGGEKIDHHDTRPYRRVPLSVRYL